MNSLYKAYHLMKTRPIGCGASLLFSLLLVLGSLCGVLFISFAMFAAPKFKSLVYSETGFHPSMEDASVNLFTGECVFHKFSLENPHGVYDSESFLKTNKFSIKLSPLKLLIGDIEFTEIYIDALDVSCIRLNNSTYNLSEFLEKFSKVCKIKKTSNGYALKNFTLKIKDAHYIDNSAADKMNWKLKVDLNFSAQNVDDVDSFIKTLMENLDESNAKFISRGVRVLLSDKNKK